MKSMREVKQVIEGIKASDGDGVQLTRIIGSTALESLDPFLLLDAFGSDKPQDYIGGFPAHPHRGFETVTYMLAGKMRHKDSAGNEGLIEAGGVQWMTAGKGIIHSEMPEQEEGLLAGFQLWVNIPASHKMIAPKYQERSQNEINQEVRDNGSNVIVIAGTTKEGTKGIIDNKFIEPTYWDVQMPEKSIFEEAINSEHNAFVYLIDGHIEIGNLKKPLKAGQLAVLDKGTEISIKAEKESRFLLVAGKPLNEPVVKAGPFAMNTREEIQQAFNDYNSGRLA